MEKTGTVLICDDNESMGYLCCECAADAHLVPAARRLFVVFWAGENARRVVYRTQQRFADEMKVFVGSRLAEHSELHKAKEFAGAAFLEYCEHLGWGEQARQGEAT